MFNQRVLLAEVFCLKVENVFSNRKPFVQPILTMDLVLTNQMIVTMKNPFITKLKNNQVSHKFKFNFFFAFDLCNRNGTFHLIIFCNLFSEAYDKLNFLKQNPVDPHYNQLNDLLSPR